MNDLSPTDVWIYEGLIEVADAEKALGNPRSSPSAIGWATEVLTGSKIKGQVAAAKAKLAEAKRREGY